MPLLARAALGGVILIGTGLSPVASGVFASAGDRNDILHVATVDSSEDAHWATVGGPKDLVGVVYALALYRGNLAAGGEFLWTSSTRVNAIATWNGSTWEGMGQGVEHGGCPGLECFPRVRALLPFGDDLIVAGNFIKAGGQPANYIARWDGASWHPLGFGVDDQVFALAEYQGDLIAGGLFLHAGGQPANHIARWDGTSWHPLNGGVDGRVGELLVFDGRLIVAGQFHAADQVVAQNIAAWDGTRWDPLGAGSDISPGALAEFEGQLIADGWFRNPETLARFALARWDGASWVQFGPVVGGPNAALAVYHGDLVRGFAGQQYYIERWDGAAWHPLGSGTDAMVHALCPTETTLYVGGDFMTAGGKTAWFIARWNDIITPVFIEELVAASEESAVRIEWRLSRDAAWNLREIAVERAEARPGPYLELARMYPEPGLTMNFTDTDGHPDESRWYRLRLTLHDGSETMAGPVEGRANGWSTVLDQPVDSAADRPVEIRYRIAGRTMTPFRLEIFAPTGQLLRVLQQGMVSPGAYVSFWDRRTETGSAVARGMYFVRLATDRGQTGRKLIVFHR